MSAKKTIRRILFRKYRERNKESMTKEEAITPEEFKEQMASMRKIDDEEERHYKMDCLMMEVLNQLGYEEGTIIFDNTEKWYS